MTALALCINITGFTTDRNKDMSIVLIKTEPCLHFVFHPPVKYLSFFKDEGKLIFGRIIFWKYKVVHASSTRMWKHKVTV